MWFKCTLFALTFCHLSTAAFISSSDNSNSPACIKGPDTSLDLPLIAAGDKYFYLGIFSKLNWYRAAQFCLYHGMNFASITSKEQNDAIIDNIQNQGLSDERFWMSGTDLGKEGSFFWLSNGRQFEFQDWVFAQPDNANGNENCVQLWNPERTGMKWNDAPCTHEHYFICEII